LLSSIHSVGKAKARFFREFGFNDSNIAFWETSLLDIAKTADVAEVTSNPFGVKYIIDGSIPTPVGITVNIRTVWIIETGEKYPRFVTAYPLPRDGA